MLAVVGSLNQNIRMNIGSPGPEFIGSRPSMVDRCRPRHARSLRRVEIELLGRNDLNSIIAPIVLRCSVHLILLFLQSGCYREVIPLTNNVAVEVTTELKPEAGFRRHD